MKKKVLLLIAFICASFVFVLAQTPSPRTGNLPKKQILTQEEFDQKPQEVQQIIKDHPELYEVRSSMNTYKVSQEEYQSMPDVKKQYINDHPEKYEIENEKQSVQTAIKNEDGVNPKQD